MAIPKHSETWIWWDLTEYGSNNLQAISVAEMRELHRGAELLIEQHPREEIDQLILDQTRNLRRDAERGRVTGEWVSRAVLLIAIKGLKGHKIPWHLNSSA